MASEWWEWNGDLAKDIHDSLKIKENTMLRLQGGSKLMYWRRFLVDWLALTCQKYHLTGNAQHLAVCLYDRFTDKHDLAVEDLQMLIVCCLLVASKFEEREEKIPKFKLLMDHLQWELNPSEYLTMEIRLLSAFDWNIGFPTASHFKEYYMQVALGERDLLGGQPICNKEQTTIYLEKNINYFLEVSLQDQTFLVFKPSLITASCVAASRICLHISPTWTIELRKTTTFAWHHLVPCINILLRLHDGDKQAMRREARAASTLPDSGGELTSTGSTPVVSPLPPTFPADTPRLPSHGPTDPIHRYNRGYVI